MKEQILNFIQKRKTVSFIELENNIDGFSGDEAWGVPDMNMFFWTRLSQEAGGALIELINENLIKMTPTSALVYVVDGFETTMETVKSIRKHKKPAWFPVVFNPVEH